MWGCAAHGKAKNSVQLLSVTKYCSPSSPVSFSLLPTPLLPISFFLLTPSFFPSSLPLLPSPPSSLSLPLPPSPLSFSPFSPPPPSPLPHSHENGMVRFWDVTTGAMRLIYELKTANLFVGQEPEANLREFEEFSWPPYRKVSSYDPYEDDPRLAVKFIEFCPHSRTLCVGGNGGQVITFSLNPLPNEIRLEVSIVFSSRTKTSSK